MRMASNLYRTPNLNRTFVRAAKKIADKIRTINGVIGIVAAGGIGRGHSDRFSDLDMFVYAEPDMAPKIRKYIAVGYVCYRDVDFDIPVESYQKLLRMRVPSAYWNQVMRWTLENSRILFDSGDRVKHLLETKIVFPEAERRELMQKYHQEINDIINYIFPTWEERGYTYHLAGLLRKAAEFIILWIYAKNYRFQPYLSKWLFYHLETGAVPEAEYFPLIKQAYMRPVSSRAEAKKLRTELFRLCDRTGIGIYPADLEKEQERRRRSWEKASEKTKYYLSF